MHYPFSITPPKFGRVLGAGMKKVLAPGCISLMAAASARPARAQSGTYTTDEIILQGNLSSAASPKELASIVEQAVGQYGLPNGYILGRKDPARSSPACATAGTLYTRTPAAPDLLAGPSLGADLADPATGDDLISQSARPRLDVLNYLGVQLPTSWPAGMTVARGGTYVVPSFRRRARLGVNVGYRSSPGHMDPF